MVELSDFTRLAYGISSALVVGFVALCLWQHRSTTRALRRLEHRLSHEA